MCLELASCSDNSRSSYDYRCGEGGMEMKMEEMTDVLRENRNVQQKFSLCLFIDRKMPEGIVWDKSSSKAVETHVVILHDRTEVDTKSQRELDWTKTPWDINSCFFF